MEHVNDLFMEALGASLRQRQLTWQEKDVSSEELAKLFRMAEMHHVLPMIFETLHQAKAVQEQGAYFVSMLRHQTMQSVAVQTMKTVEFEELYAGARRAGLSPLVVKGIVCRSLYPNPDARISGDEDVLIHPDEYLKFHQYLLEHGMKVADTGVDIEKEHEIPYIKDGGALYIEVHKSLFPPQSEAYGMLNHFFEDVHNHPVVLKIDGTDFLTLDHTENLFYLICHSFKHFLHSGFGLRQVCDIVLYAQKYGSFIDWKRVLDDCREIRADLFSAALFRIGVRFFSFDPVSAGMGEEWTSIQVDEYLMLKDLLASGVFGQSDMSRKHSSNITLDAVVANKNGKKAKAGVLSSVFQPKSYMEKRYPYLKKAPWLLPVAWTQRVVTYKKESSKDKAGNKASESIRIGKERVELMRAYGIIR